jgi:hypothetical protein
LELFPLVMGAIVDFGLEKNIEADAERANLLKVKV